MKLSRGKGRKREGRRQVGLPKQPTVSLSFSMRDCFLDRIPRPFAPLPKWAALKNGDGGALESWSKLFCLRPNLHWSFADIVGQQQGLRGKGTGQLQSSVQNLTEARWHKSTGVDNKSKTRGTWE